jgi:hypothetical protein
VCNNGLESRLLLAQVGRTHDDPQHSGFIRLLVAAEERLLRLSPGGRRGRSRKMRSITVRTLASIGQSHSRPSMSVSPVAMNPVPLPGYVWLDMARKPLLP